MMTEIAAIGEPAWISEARAAGLRHADAEQARRGYYSDEIRQIDREIGEIAFHRGMTPEQYIVDMKARYPEVRGYPIDPLPVMEPGLKNISISITIGEPSPER